MKPRNKEQNKEKQISVSSLGAPEHSGWITKRGGKIQTWKRRWMVLKDSTLYYFTKTNAKKLSGAIALTRDTTVSETASAHKKICLQIGTPGGRVYYMYTDSDGERKMWFDVILSVLPHANASPVTFTDGSDSSGDSTSSSARRSTFGGLESDVVYKHAVVTTASHDSLRHRTSTPLINRQKQPLRHSASLGEKSTWISHTQDAKRDAGLKWEELKDFLPFQHLKELPSRITESNGLFLLNSWIKHLGSSRESCAGMPFSIQVSSDFSEQTLMTYKTQNRMIASLESFFLSVGSTEKELDFLQEVGAIMKPTNLGMWLTVTNSGGLDGGWIFPGCVQNMRDAVISSLPSSTPPATFYDSTSEPIQAIITWLDNFNLGSCTSIKRDLGPNPPETTQFVIPLHSGQYSEQAFTILLAAFSSFGFPMPADGFDAFKWFIMSQPGQIQLNCTVTVAGSQISKLGVSVILPAKDYFYESLQNVCDSLAIPTARVHTTALQSLTKTNDLVEVTFEYRRDNFCYGVYAPGWSLYLAWSNFFS